MTMRFSFRRYLTVSMISLGVAGAAGTGVGLPQGPAHAQFTVFDPTNYSQNLLTAAHSLQQVNNQIQMLQNQAQSLINQARNLTTVSFPELTTLQQTIQKIDQLMAQASNIQFHVTGLDQQYRALFPSTFNAAMTNDQHVVDARNRLGTSMAAYQQTMTVQAQVVENIASDEASLNSLVARSQGAQGALQVQQTTNQLLALVAKQQFQIEHMMAAQYRADAIERATRTQAQSDAGSAATKFLGSGNAYTPH
jgi:P-type conjugative transfer protein TrbJ